MEKPELVPLRRLVSVTFVCRGGVLLFLEPTVAGLCWLTPGGEVEPGEEDLVAAKRVLKEKLDLGDEFLGSLRFRRHFCPQRVEWNGGRYEVTNFLVEVTEEFTFRFLVGQKEYGWLNELPSGPTTEWVEIFFLRLRLDGLVSKS